MYNTKLKIKAVREIIAGTPKELKGQQISTFKERLQIGYAMKSNANWAYQVWAIMHNGFVVPVVSCFGEIK